MFLELVRSGRSLHSDVEVLHQLIPWYTSLVERRKTLSHIPAVAAMVGVLKQHFDVIFAAHILPLLNQAGSFTYLDHAQKGEKIRNSMCHWTLIQGGNQFDLLLLPYMASLQNLGVTVTPNEVVLWNRTQGAAGVVDFCVKFQSVDFIRAMITVLLGCVNKCLEWARTFPGHTFF